MATLLIYSVDGCRVMDEARRMINIRNLTSSHAKMSHQDHHCSPDREMIVATSSCVCDFSIRANPLS